MKHLQSLLLLTLFCFSVNSQSAVITTPFPFTAPGVVEVSYPYFVDSSESIKVKKLTAGTETYWQITGTGHSSVFNGPNSRYSLTGETTTYTANFDISGQLITSIGSTTLTNSLTITGTMPAGTIGNTSWDKTPKNTLLLSATLKAPTVGIYSNNAIGFDTDFISGWAFDNKGLTGGSLGESLWLTGNSVGFKKLVRALDSDIANGTLETLFKAKTSSISSVKSIASVPLLSSGLVMFTGLLTLYGFRITR